MNLANRPNDALAYAGRLPPCQFLKETREIPRRHSLQVQPENQFLDVFCFPQLFRNDCRFKTDVASRFHVAGSRHPDGHLADSGQHFPFGMVTVSYDPLFVRPFQS